MAITARSENHSIVDLEPLLIHFICEKNRSASALVISRVQATTKKAIYVWESTFITNFKC